jgi:hypothetical protein
MAAPVWRLAKGVSKVRLLKFVAGDAEVQQKGRPRKQRFCSLYHSKWQFSFDWLCVALLVVCRQTLKCALGRYLARVTAAVRHLGSSV